MAVVGPQCRSGSSVAMNAMNGANNRHSSVSTSSHNSAVSNGSVGHSLHTQHNAILAAAQPFYSTNHSINTQDMQPDRPIGYGAFGVVWSVTDPRDGKRVALKKMPNVFQNLVSSKRVYREIKMLCFFKHENVLSAADILQPPHIDFFQEIYVITELMQSDLHKIIVSSQPLTSDHVKVFLYQILRGLKYLHSARILHRDIKPGNLLVNSNCLLKICDFGLARVEESDSSKLMTQEVVTQYYRAPELLMGARHYTSSIDIWSVGCIFAELLGRRILFQAQTPIQQLELITDLLGTPEPSDMRYACEGARIHIQRRPCKTSSLGSLYNLSPQANHEAVHLLCQMLVFNPSPVSGRRPPSVPLMYVPVLRVEESDSSKLMTQEVVTQYYRAPELLMGARHYTSSIDIWSVGCIFAELLGRRILFQAQTPIQQLELITDLLGTPEPSDMRYACEGARIHIQRRPCKTSSLGSLYNLSPQANHEAVHLLCQILRNSVGIDLLPAEAMVSTYTATTHSVGSSRRYVTDLEPLAQSPFDYTFEKELSSVHMVKERLHKSILEKCSLSSLSNRVPLCINPHSAAFKSFASSTVAHPSELPPSPHCWE
ncbi:unnamed protein product, partial [Medioppia subpectinata]